MKKIFLLFVVMLSVSMTFGQYYGLLGKRVIFNIEGTTSPAYVNPNFICQELDARGKDKLGLLSLNFFATPSIEIPLWEQGTIGVGYNFFTSPFEGYQDNLYYRDNPTEPNVYSYTRSFDGHVTAHGFNLYYKQYLGNSKAPVGHYLKINLDCFFPKYVMDGTYTYAKDGEGNLLRDSLTGKLIKQIHGAIPDYLTDSIPPNQHLLYYWPDGEFDPENPYALSSVRSKRSVLLGLKVEYGYDFWPTNFMKLSLGVSLGSTFGGYKGIIKDNDFSGGSRTFQNYAHARILGAYWIQFKLGIGFMPF